MTDRELLELAAKAAGIKGEALYTECLGAWISKQNLSVWSPLTDDGDALRLAVALNEFEPYRSNGGWRISPGDNLESARRAIVRAAAEIGKAM